MVEEAGVFSEDKPDGKLGGLRAASLIQVSGVDTLKDALVNQQRQSCLQPPHFQLRADLCLSEKLIESFFFPFCSRSKIHTLGLFSNIISS